MGSLSGCLKAAGKALAKDDSERIRNRTLELIADGADPQRAALTAIDEALREVAGEWAALDDQVRDRVPDGLPSLPAISGEMPPAPARAGAKQAATDEPQKPSPEAETGMRLSRRGPWDFEQTFPVPRRRKLAKSGEVSMFDGLSGAELLEAVEDFTRETGSKAQAAHDRAERMRESIQQGLDPETLKPFESEKARNDAVRALGAAMTSADSDLNDYATEFGEKAAAALRATLGVAPSRAVPEAAVTAPIGSERIEAAAAEAATSPQNDKPEPTEAQKEAGNYAKGHVVINGLDISIENPAGTRRRPEWKPLAHHYGYIKRTESKDGDHVDVFIGPKAEDASLPVFIVNQVKPYGKREFDEHKVMLGFASSDEAERGYRSNYDDDWRGTGDIVRMSLDQFKAWLRSGDTTKPAPSSDDRKAPSQNTIFTEDAAAKARELLRKNLGGKLSAGLDPEIVRAGLTLAGYHIERGSRTFAAYARAMLDDLGDIVRPYLKAWYAAVYFDPAAAEFQQDMTGPADLAAAEVPDAPSVERDLEGSRPDDGDGTVAPIGEPAGVGTRTGTGQDVGAAAGQRQGSRGVRGRRAAAGGAQSNLALDSGERRNAVDPAGSDDGAGGGDSGGPRVSPDRAGAGASALAARDRSEAGRLAAQRSADATPIKVGDLDNIRATLPYLLPGQQEDVLKAEQRYAKPDGYGMLFTNGTGTGKTFTGLGIIKRFVRSGKGNILIAVPTNKIANDWIGSATRLGLNITMLPDTKNAGAGVVITTYANMRANDALVARKWDLVVADESHYLNASAEAEDTKAIEAIRALTMHPRGVNRRADMLTPDSLRQVLKAASQTRAPATESQRRAYAEFDALRKQVETDVMATQRDRRPRLLMLSATPFAYEKSVDLAEGYLFDYASDDGTGGYNVARGRDAFFVQHFGYRMRYNKLTQPGPEVDRSVMQRQFNTWLKQQGVLSGRALEVEPDYDRRFILIESAIGRRIDEALEFIRTKASEEEYDGPRGWRLLSDRLEKRFDYLSRTYLLEAIKADAAIPIVKKHLALGRKVVVFHDFKKGGGFNPFRFGMLDDGEIGEDGSTEIDAKTAAAHNAAVEAFNAAFADLVDSGIEAMPPPLAVFRSKLPQTLIFNGSVSPKDRRAAADKFNDDASGPQVILVQSAAGREGISLHDTTGKHQRVLINLGMPVAPTAATQIEGRIYRTGQVSNAPIRYLNTGTSWETFAFASKIAQRASAAENLSAGELARALKQSFIDAFEESAPWEPGHDGEGTGGKERDMAANAALTEFDRAMSFYYGQQKKNARTKSAEGTDYFATPEPVGLKMVEWADVRPLERMLEPSAGHGAIARWFPDNTDRTVVEPSNELRSRVALIFNGRIVADLFENLHAVNKYDVIVMNPPFGQGGATAVSHLAKAAEVHLADEGRVVALLPTGTAADKAFGKWYESANGLHVVADIRLPQVTFERAATAVATRIVVIDKSANPPQQVVRDYSSAKTIKELFDRLRDATIPKRSKPAQTDYDDAQAPAQPVAGASGVGARSGHSTGFQLGQTKHAKTGEELFVARMTARVSKEQYQAIAAIAKRFGGWYSSYDKQGAIPGFQFKSEAKRAEFLAAAGASSDGSVIGSGAGTSDGYAIRDRSTPSGPLPQSDLPRLRSIAEAVQREYGVRINVVPNANDPSLPSAARGLDDGSRGFTDLNQTWLFTDRTPSLAAAERVIAHEVIGHVGVERVIGDAWPQVVAWVRRVLDGTEKVDARTEGAVRNARSRYPDANDTLLAKEAVAIMAERGIKGSIMDRVIAAVRRFLRLVKRSLAVSEHEVRDLLSRAATELRRRAARGEQAPASPAVAMYARGGMSVPAQVQALIDREAALSTRVDRAYERGALDEAERLDAELAEVRGRLEAAVAEVEESEVSNQDERLFSRGDAGDGSDLGPAEQAIRDGLGKGQRIDRLFELLLRPISGKPDEFRRASRGKRLQRWARMVIRDWRPHPDGRLRFLDPLLHKARAGWLDRFGLEDSYVDRDHQRRVEIDRVLLAGQDVLKSLGNLSNEEARVLQAMMTGEAISEGDIGRIAQPIIDAIDAMGQEAVELGLITQEAYERNRGAYLHRSYRKHENQLAGNRGLLDRLLTMRRKRLIGNQLKRRGMVMQRSAATIARALGLADLAEGTYVKVLRQKTADGGVRTKYQKPSDDVPVGWENLGDWRVQGVGKDGTATLWRDYTKEERDRMGEILDARYNIGKTYMLMAHDLATGRFHRDIAANENWTRVTPPEGETVMDGREAAYSTHTESAWVRVPDTSISNTRGADGKQVKAWGALAGKYVRSEIWRDLLQLREMQSPTVLGDVWQSALSTWKANKTYRSPTVHMNNLMSNFLFMDLADVRLRDLLSGFRTYLNRETSKDYRDAQEHGVFGSGFVQSELRQNVLDPLLRDILKEYGDAKDDTVAANLGLLQKLGTLWERVDGKAQEFYQLEDEVFRLALYMRLRAEGSEPDVAAKEARAQFIDYDIRAPWVNALRNSVLPFIAYTYRAVPLIAKSLSHRPWKLAKYATVAWAANALSYLFAPGDEDDERKVMRESEQGNVWGFIPRMVRMPWYDSDGNPVFLDVRRWIPAGDVFDTTSSEMGIPAWMQFGGPLALGMQFSMNHDSFTKRPIVEPTQSHGEKALAATAWAYRAWMPNAPWIPGSYSWDKIITAARGGPDYSLPQAAASSVGIKLRGLDVEGERVKRAQELSRELSDVRAERARLERQVSEGRISRFWYATRVAAAEAKMRKYGERMAALQKGVPPAQ